MITKDLTPYAVKGKGRVVNARFAVMRAHYLFDPNFCNVASGWEKGVAETLELEQDEMMPMTTPFDGYVEKSARVSSTCLVSVQRNRYSVPREFAGQRVSTRGYPNRVSVAALDEAVAGSVALSNFKGKKVNKISTIC